jgi:UDP-glucuronate 4-epimerase
VAVDGLFAREAPQLVVHLAAQAGVRYSVENPRAYGSANLEGFLNVLEACRHGAVRHLVFASSSSVYGLNAATPFSEHAVVAHPASLYAATKRANELMAHAYAHQFGLPATGLRFFTVYGPWGRPDMAAFAFTRAILAGEPVTLYRGGTLSRDFTYIDDAVEAVLRLAARPPAPQPGFDRSAPDPAASSAPFRLFNIGNHRSETVNALVAAIEQATGRSAIRLHAEMPPGDIERTFADVTALEGAIGFVPSTPIAEGISRFVAWYREYYRC